MDSSSGAEHDLAFVIPARNEERYLPSALASVCGQTVPLARLEAVVVENGSTDRTAQVALDFARTAKDLEVQVIRNDVTGIAAAKNRGASEARARVVLFLDADSRAAPDLAQRVLAWEQRGYPAGSIRITADSTDLLDRGFFGLIEWGKGLFHIKAQMLYCRKDLFQRFGGFGQSIQLAEDQEFLRRLQRSGVPVCHVRDSSIATSTRRLHTLPFRLGMLVMFVRWALAHMGIGRRWRY
jgi:glycosyltransferase involved in cell wall biosynthesis